MSRWQSAAHLSSRVNQIASLQEDLWRANALRTLPVLMGASEMMVCGEDLGMIPACVHPVMERLGLLGESKHAF